MIEKIGSLLAGAKMSLQEWLAVSVAVVIGGLVAALKIQGSRLHRAQVQLLDQNLTSKANRAHEGTADARGKYQDAIDSYLKAGGTLLLLVSLALGAPARSESQNPLLLPKCQAALSSCAALVKAQDEEISVINDNIKQWKKAAEHNEPSFLEEIPWQVWVGVGLVAGGVLGFEFGRAVK